MPVNQQYNDAQVAEICDDEGLDYAVRHYMGSTAIQNPVTAKLWDEAANALNALANHLMLDDR